MAITLDGSGGLFTRLGKIGFAFNVVNEWCGQSGSAIAEDLPGLTADIQLQFDGATADIRALVGGMPSALEGGRRGMTAYKAALKKVAQDVLIKMVNDDDPQPTLSLADALAELIRQMVAGTETIKANTVSATPAAGGSNVGTGVITASVLGGDGKTLEYALAEDLELTVTSTTTSGAETWRSKGEAAVGDKLSHEWPAGSGSTATLTSRTGISSVNLVGDGDFETFTVANVPDGWTAVAGTAGTHFGEENSIQYKDTSALKFIGNGATNPNLTYTLTVADLLPKTPYAFNLFNRVSAAAATGVAVIDLIDGSNNVIADEAGTNNSITVDLTALTTSYSAVNGFFRLPDPIPDTVKLRIRTTTALENAKNWVIDELCLIEATRQYSNYGPYLAVFSGATDWSGDDLYTVAIANNRAGLFQSFLPIVYDIEGTGLILPSTGSPSIAEALFA